MSEIHMIANGECLDRLLDVVFVHGADGDWQNTWRIDNASDKFWPRWLGQDAPQVGIWSLDYDASSLAWKGSTMPLVDRADNVLDVMDVRGFGQRPILFVCHSLGGLLVKQMLRNVSDYNQKAYGHIEQQTRGIVFLSTPHSGAELATTTNALNRLLLGLLRPTVTVEELNAHHARLLELNRWYRNHAPEKKIITWVYYEKHPTKGVLVVNASTADPGITSVNPVPMDDDHSSICKLQNRDSQIYQRVRKLIEEMTATSARTVESRSALPMHEASPAPDTSLMAAIEQNNVAPGTLRKQLYKVLIGKRFDIGDLEALAYDLDIPWDHLSGNNQPGKALALVRECEKRGRLEELRELIMQERPNLDLANPR